MSVDGAALRQLHDHLLLDLDGTLYHGPQAIPSAVAALSGSRSVVTYVTNNASRSPAEVARALAGMGYAATEEQVATSAQAAATVLAERLAPSAKVLVVGAEALADELRLRGLSPVREFADGPTGVAQGHSPSTGWAQLAEAALAIRAGALWVACNVDPTLPTERGLLPGNGSMVAALRTATDTEPLVAGKPAKPLLEAALGRVPAQAPLVVGDRLDTDVAGANAVGAASLLVLTGVSGPAELLTAPSLLRPTYVAGDLSALDELAEALKPAPAPGWQIELDGEELVVEAVRGAAHDGFVGLRAVLWAAWGADGPVKSVRLVADAAQQLLGAWFTDLKRIG